MSRHWVGLCASVVEAGVSALVPGSGPLVGLASQALEPEKERLRQWRQDKAERDRLLRSVSMWARAKRFGDADIELGLEAAEEILRQKGASMVRVAELNLDPVAVAGQVVAGDWQPQKTLSAEGRQVCAVTVEIFYRRLISQNHTALNRAVQRVLLLRSGSTLDKVEALLLVQERRESESAAVLLRFTDVSGNVYEIFDRDVAYRVVGGRIGA